jgi:hypothetical protein
MLKIDCFKPTLKEMLEGKNSAQSAPTSGRKLFELEVGCLNQKQAV